jgi:hypothetical protein
MRKIGCPETSATNHQPILRNMTEELIPHLHRFGSQKSWHCVDGRAGANVSKEHSPFFFTVKMTVLQFFETWELLAQQHGVTFQKTWIFSFHNSGKKNPQGRRIGGPINMIFITGTVFINTDCTGNAYFHKFFLDHARISHNFVLVSWILYH